MSEEPYNKSVDSETAKKEAKIELEKEAPPKEKKQP